MCVTTLLFIFSSTRELPNTAECYHPCNLLPSVTHCQVLPPAREL